MLGHIHTHADLKDILVEDSPQIQWSSHVRCLCVFSVGKRLSLEECGYQPSLHCHSVILQVWQTPMQRDPVGCSPLESRKAQNVSLRTTIYRIPRQLILVLIFHSGCNLLRQGPRAGGEDTLPHSSPCYLMPPWIFTHILKIFLFACK